ncbi:MAG: ATP phosphoribosyltransferase [Saprospiraceae bacterium]|jgi:ATP phosphoribosyltransferase|nr:ATP phosphoribosyltransferase [Saprospiraceae bacterium]
MQSPILKIAIQKSGRLSDDSKKLLKECGIKFQNGKSQLVAPSTNFPIEILYLRVADIPQYIADGIADIGIIGENVFLEKNENIENTKKLGFSKCRLSLAIPKAETYTNLSFFEGKKIATSYPIILSNFLAKNNIKSDIHKISGSVEIAPNIGLADAVCDIVSTGSTLLSNGLKEVTTILKSEAVLAKNKNLSIEKAKIFKKLLFRIDAVQAAQTSKYILLNAPTKAIPEIIKILPGAKSPTIIPLAIEGWSSLHSVVKEETFWDVIDELKLKGAEGILVIPIEKIIT